ncbi:aspartyl-phosphate phosphatase Spo0E family protein [Priestia aryabhattai]
MLILNSRILLCPILGPLLSEIEGTRNLIIDIETKKRVGSKRTVEISRKLDALLNEFNTKKLELDDGVNNIFYNIVDGHYKVKI